MRRVEIKQGVNEQRVDVAEIPVKGRNHSWPHTADDLGYRSIDGHDQPDGNSRTERACRVCGLIKITMHSPDGRSWREWRRPGESKSFKAARTPVCFGEGPEAANE